MLAAAFRLPVRAHTAHVAAAALVACRFASGDATRRFTKSHEWVSVKGDVGTVGITDYAQDKLGDIVYVAFPQVGKKFTNTGTPARAGTAQRQSARATDSGQRSTCPRCGGCAATETDKKVIASIESVKTTADVYAPVDMEVLEVNKELPNAWDLLNKSPEGDGRRPTAGRGGGRAGRPSADAASARPRAARSPTGWLIKVKVLNPSQLDKLLDAAAYKQHCETATDDH